VLISDVPLKESNASQSVLFAKVDFETYDALVILELVF